MECPFCAGDVLDEALVCKNCSRDLRVVKPVILEIQDLVLELDQLQRLMNSVRTNLNLADRPVSFIATLFAGYVLLPVALLLGAHYVIIYMLNQSELWLRLAAVLIPLPFGMALYVVNYISFRGAFALGLVDAIISVFGMLIVVSLLDQVPILPQTGLDWREDAEFVFSIALAFVTGNLLALSVFHLLPSAFASTGKPDGVALALAKFLGEHIGEDGLRRRARKISVLTQKIGPLVGIAITAVGSIYAGLKGVLGW
jgi:hypothetical protein